jgi:hypothetical protein
MHFVSYPPPKADDGREPRPGEESNAMRSEVRRRQDAASFLEAAATADDQVTRQSLLRRAAELLSPGPRSQGR